jgi:hypothetical protein
MALSKDDQKLLHAKLTEILNRHDPIGLIALGAPKDEYEPEVETIVPRLSAAENAADVTRIVWDEFGRWFGAASTTGPESAYQPLVQEVWELLVDDFRR